MHRLVCPKHTHTHTLAVNWNRQGGGECFADWRHLQVIGSGEGEGEGEDEDTLHLNETEGWDGTMMVVNIT